MTPITVALITALGVIVTALLTWLGTKKKVQSELRSAELDHSVEIISKWRELAEAGDERAKTLEARLDALEIRYREDREDQNARITSLETRLTDALVHVIELWRWIEAGSPPPPPAKPARLKEFLEKEYGGVAWGYSPPAGKDGP